MACIICFLDDEYQENIRNISQSKGERFEDSLNEYRDNFFAELKILNSIRKCTKHNTLNYQTIVWATRLHQTIIRIKNKASFFDSIVTCYILWISGSTVKAINSLNEILKEKDILSLREQIDTSIYFRGRKSQSLLSKEDLYHIPFNKRFLISNQRYSLTGQPIFYFGLSVLDVLAELRVSVNSFEDVNFSSFVATDNSFKIFDFTNPFQSEISAVDNILTSSPESKIDYNDSYFGINSTKHLKGFYKYILLCISSFKRTIENSNFTEEYVIPQMLTEITRNNKFDGILFPSTRINKDIAYSIEKFHVSKYKENLALFTEYQSAEKFDNNLIEKFIIGKPIKYKDIIEIDFIEIEKLGRQIIQLNNKKGVFKSLKQVAELTGISYKIQYENLLVKDENNNYIKYFDHKVGKIHNYILYTQLLTIRNTFL
jgi:hypothetical protein